MRIQIKPLSVNEAWQGRRYKTVRYKNYEKELLFKLPKTFKSNFSELEIEIGVNTLFDIDNCLKPLLDVMQKKYKFNDRDIMKLTIKKTIVKKGNEFICIK